MKNRWRTQTEVLAKSREYEELKQTINSLKDLCHDDFLALVIKTLKKHFVNKMHLLVEPFVISFFKGQECRGCASQVRTFEYLKCKCITLSLSF